MPLPLIIAVTLTGCMAINGSRLVLVLHGLGLGATPIDVGVLSGLLWFFPLLISWPVGRFADRYGTRWLLLAGAASGRGRIAVTAFYSRTAGAVCRRSAGWILECTVPRNLAKPDAGAGDSRHAAPAISFSTA